MGKIDEELKEQVKKKAKDIGKKLLIKSIPIIIGLLLVVIVASLLFSVFNTIKEAMIELMSNITTAISSFWKWITDDYWIKLDKEITFENEEDRYGGNTN